MRYLLLFLLALAWPLGAQDSGCIVAGGVLQHLAWWQHYAPQGGAGAPPAAAPLVAPSGGSATETFVAGAPNGIVQTIYKLSRMPLPGTITARVNGAAVAAASSGDVVAIPPAVGVAAAGYRMGRSYVVDQVRAGDTVSISYRW